jgi:hypothetical protein
VIADRCADCGCEVHDDEGDCVMDDDDLVCLECLEERRHAARLEEKDRMLDDPRRGQARDLNGRSK